MKNVIAFLSAAILFLCSSEMLLASNRTYARANYRGGGYGFSGGSSGNEPNIDPEQARLAANYPFTKANSPIEKDKVVGMRISAQETTLLGEENTFYCENSSGEERFASIKFFSQYPNLLSVEIKDVNLSGQDLENICNFIGSTKIKNLVFDSCVIAEGDVKYIADTIKKLDSLIAVSVKFIKTQDKKGKIVQISPETVQEVTQAISGKDKLVSLSVAFDEINSESCDHIVTAMKQSPNMTMLSLCWNNVTGEEAEKSYNDLAEALSSLKKLKTLCFSIIKLPEACIDTQLSSISDLEKLTNLTISIGNLKDSPGIFEHASNLGSMLEKLPRLASLQLQNMGLSASATQPIIQSFSKLTELKYLDMSGNKINKEGGVIAGESLKENTELRAIIMRNCGITSETFAKICEALPSTSVSIACFGNNEIKEGIRNFQTSQYSDLRCVDLAKNQSSVEDIMLFIENSISHERLQTVDLRNNAEVSSKQRDKIARMKSDKKSTVMYLVDCNLPKGQSQNKKAANSRSSVNRVMGK